MYPITPHFSEIMYNKHITALSKAVGKEIP